MSDLEMLKAKLEALDMERFELQRQIDDLVDRDRRVAIRIAGLDPDALYTVSEGYRQWYRENVPNGTWASNFLNKVFRVKFISGNGQPYMVSDEALVAVGASIPAEFLTRPAHTPAEGGEG